LENMKQSINLELGDNVAIVIVMNTYFCVTLDNYYMTFLLNRELVE